MLGIYSFEKFSKIFGEGVIKYISDLWNIYELIIYVLYWMYVHKSGIIFFDVSPFRLMKILLFMATFIERFNIIIIN